MNPTVGLPAYYLCEMENLVLIVRPQAYNAYHDHPELLEPIFALFQTAVDGEYVMLDVTAATDVRITTLYSCCERYRTDPQWRLLRDHFCENRRVFSDNTEAYLQISFAFISLSWFIHSHAPLSSL